MGKVLMAALGHAFFCLSLGMAIMVSYGSYLKQDVDLLATARGDYLGYYLLIGGRSCDFPDFYLAIIWIQRQVPVWCCDLANRLWSNEPRCGGGYFILLVIDFCGIDVVDFNS